MVRSSSSEMIVGSELVGNAADCKSNPRPESRASITNVPRPNGLKIAEHLQDQMIVGSGLDGGAVDDKSNPYPKSRASITNVPRPNDLKIAEHLQDQMIVGSGLDGRAAEYKTNPHPMNGEHPRIFRYIEAANVRHAARAILPGKSPTCPTETGIGQKADPWFC